MNLEMKERLRAGVAGLFILTAYFVLAELLTDSVVLITALEVFSGLSVIGIAVLLYPRIKGEEPNLIGRGYYSLKWIEGLIMVAGGIMVLIGTSSALEFKELIYNVHLVAFAVSALFLYMLMLKSPIIPKWMSYWGIIAVVLLIIGNYLPLFIGELNQTVAALCFSQIMLNEVVMATYLIVHGFSKKQNTSYALEA